MKNHGECEKTNEDIKLVTTEKEETFWCQNQIIIQQNFSLKIY